MKRNLSLVLMSSIGLVAIACGGGGSSTPDAHVPHPDGSAIDAPNAMIDASPTPDANLLPDAPPTIDATPGTPDATIVVDATVPTADAAPPTGACAAITPITLGTPTMGTLAGMTTETPDNPTCSATNTGPENIYSFTLDHTADLVWNVAPVDMGIDPVAYIRSVCSGVDGAGNLIPDPICADTGGPGTAERATLDDAAPGTYYFVADSYGAMDAGDYTATLTLREIVGAGATCDGIATRCSTGLSCIMGVCTDTTAACMAGATGTLVPGTPSMGDTTTAMNNLTCAGSGLGNDQYWNLAADATGGTYVVQMTSTDHNVRVYSTDNCTDATVATNCTGGGTMEAHFDLDLAAGAFTYIVADGFTGQNGTYTLTADKVTFVGVGATCDPTSLTTRCTAPSTCDAVTNTCVAPCGNGVLSAGEQCDDGNTTAGDGCSATCQLELTYGTGAETEPNDTTATANPITGNTLVSGAKDTAMDVDTYSFTLAAGQVLIVETIDGATSTCASLAEDSRFQIFDTDGTTVLLTNDDKSVAAPADYCSYLAFVARTAGTYYLAIDASTFNPMATFDYTLRAVIYTPTYTVAAEIEPNDSAATANGPTGSALVTGTMGSATDSDYLAITAPAGFQIIGQTEDGATNTCVSGSLTSRVRIYDTNGTTQLASDTTTGPGACSIAGSGRLQTNGTHYVRTSVGSGTPFDYTVRAAVAPR